MLYFKYLLNKKVPSNSALSEGGHVSVNDTVEFGIHILQCSSETVCECENSIECPPKADLDKASNVQLTEVCLASFLVENGA